VGGAWERRCVWEGLGRGGVCGRGLVEEVCVGGPWEEVCGRGLGEEV
jgi:hypothetical protein